MTGPLEGIKVVECATWIQAPMAAAIMGDLGADVIKIEERGKGDPYRAPESTSSMQLDRSFVFETANRNKRGMALDLRKREGQEVVLKLIEESDVFIHNFRTRAVKNFGLDYGTLSGINPSLVYAQASAWGLKGPEGESGGFDAAVAGRTGFMYLVAEPDVPPPQPFANGLCDGAGAVYLALGIVCALQSRERTGKGQMVDSSLFGSAIALATWNVAIALGTGAAPVQRARVDKRNALASYYKCSDGEWIRLNMTQSDKYWPAFCQALGIAELERSPKLHNQKARIENGVYLAHILDRIFATKPRVEWMKLFADKDLICAPIQKVTDLAVDPQVEANDYIADFDHPTYGRQKTVGIPVKFSDTPGSLRRPCPEFGQHTEEVLLELGYDWDRIGDLKQHEVI